VSDPTLPSLLEEARALSVHLAEYRVGASVTPAESQTIDNSEVRARQIVDDLRTMIAARTATASLET
jgi:hypothetical protein